MSIARRAAVCAALLIVAAAVSAEMPLPSAPASAQAAPGGMASIEPPALPEAGPPGKALLIRGRAIPPLDAPPAVKQVIQAANRIRAKPYLWGGGHGSWEARGYDCSGAVSYALHGGGLLDYPLASGPLMRWERPGRGRWISVFAHGGHAYAVIAGLRWDTSGSGGAGPRWHLDTSPRPGFAVRHPAGY